jgi:hypothetical protein
MPSLGLSEYDSRGVQPLYCGYIRGLADCASFHREVHCRRTQPHRRRNDKLMLDPHVPRDLAFGRHSRSN